MYSANDQRDLEKVAAGVSPVAEFNAVIARCLLALEVCLDRPTGPILYVPVEESVTSDSPMGHALQSPVLEEDLEERRLTALTPREENHA